LPSLVGFSDSGESRIAFTTAAPSCSTGQGSRAGQLQTAELLLMTVHRTQLACHKSTSLVQLEGAAT
jgi:hypothetical protein